MPRYFAALAILAWSTLSPAQTAPPPTTAAVDPAAGVAPMRYHSAFDTLPRGVEADAVSWKAANDAVGQFPRGHRDVYKWEKTHDQPPMTSPPDMAAPARMH
jgi:hypothetical protein